MLKQRKMSPKVRYGVHGFSWTRLPMTGCVASKVPQESRRTSKVVPSEPISVTVPRRLSMAVTVWIGIREVNTSGLVWITMGLILLLCLCR